MPNDTLRVGVVGLGWAGETHLQAYLQQPGVEVVAVADPAEVRLGQIATTYNIQRDCSASLN
jgi:predicted dehydrogenase